MAYPALHVVSQMPLALREPLQIIRAHDRELGDRARRSMRELVLHATDATINGRRHRHFWTLAADELHALVLAVHRALLVGYVTVEDFADFFALVKQLLTESDPS